MDMIKSTTFITIVWTLLGVGVIVLGVYREHLYREQDNQQQNEFQQIMRKQQTVILTKVDQLLNQGKISENVANEIRTLLASEQVSIKDEALKKLSYAADDRSKEKR